MPAPFLIPAAPAASHPAASHPAASRPGPLPSRHRNPTPGAPPARRQARPPAGSPEWPAPPYATCSP